MSSTDKSYVMLAMPVMDALLSIEEGRVAPINGDLPIVFTYLKYAQEAALEFEMSDGGVVMGVRVPLCDFQSCRPIRRRVDEFEMPSALPLEDVLDVAFFPRADRYRFIFNQIFGRDPPVMYKIKKEWITDYDEWPRI